MTRVAHEPWCTADTPCHPIDFTAWTGMPVHLFIPDEKGVCRSTWFMSRCDWKKDDPRHTHKEAHP